MLAREFPGRPQSVSDARGFVATSIGPVAREVAETVALMVSELATNCVRHADTAFVVGVEHVEGVVRVEVSDASSEPPQLRSPEPTEPSGRGLLIVQALSDQWGVTAGRAGPGKTVWFTLAATDPAH